MVAGMSLLSLLPDVIAITKQAGAAIVRIYEKDEIEIQDKFDQSPLTEADLMSHRIITQRLKQLTPTIPILSEESELTPFAERRQWTDFWLIDPLDGTKEFIQRNDEFTVNIAYIRNHKPLMGVIYVPVTGELFTGLVGQGAFKQVHNGPEVPIEVVTMAERHDAGQFPEVLMSHRAKEQKLEHMLIHLERRLPGLNRRKIGSSLKFCRLAEGQADLYPRFGPTSEWDTAAGQAILEAAGGTVITLEKQVLSYNHRESLENPSFLAIADPSYQWPDCLYG